MDSRGSKTTKDQNRSVTEDRRLGRSFQGRTQSFEGVGNCFYYEKYLRPFTSDSGFHSHLILKGIGVLEGDAIPVSNGLAIINKTVIEI